MDGLHAVMELLGMLAFCKDCAQAVHTDGLHAVTEMDDMVAFAQIEVEQSFRVLVLDLFGMLPFCGY